MLAGRHWGISATDLKRLYRAYVRPGGLYAAEIWGTFTADFHIAHLKNCKNMAARSITRAPKGSPASQTRAEIGLKTMKQEIEENKSKC